MALVTEFRPVAHEFSTDNFHGAAFIGSSASDALWFYRFDATFIEVRDIFTCQDKVFASLSAAEVQQRFSDVIKGGEVHFVNVQDAYVGEYHVLIFVVRETLEDRDHVFAWNLLTLQLQRLVSPNRLLTAVTVTAQEAFMVSHRLVKTWGPTSPMSSPISSPTSLSSPEDHLALHLPPRPLISHFGPRSRKSVSKQRNQGGSNGSLGMEEENEDEDMDESNEVDDNGEEDTMSRMRRKVEQVRLQGNRRQLLALGHRNGWVTIYKFTVSANGQIHCGKVTSFATLSKQRAGSTPVIVAGTSEGRVFVIKYDSASDAQGLQVQMALEDLHSKNLPISSITLEPTKEKDVLLLAVGQGMLPGSKGCEERPTVSIYYLRLLRSDYRLLGYVQPPMLEGEIANEGRTLATTVSQDVNGLRIHCAFSIQVEQAPLRSNLTTVQINNKDVRHLDVVEMTAIEGGTLLDISSQTNSYELMVLYLGKLVTYVQAADIDSNRKEAEWTEGTTAVSQDTLLRNAAPVYSNFFQERVKFSYSQAELDEIESRRQQLGGKLFYDRLLEFVELETGVLYPPKNTSQQKNLWTNIYFNGSLEPDNRNCLAYYLLKNQHGDESEQFLKEYKIPPKFISLMDGFWALDHFDFKKAILYLSRPGLEVDWIEEVLSAIYDHGSPQLARQFLVATHLDLSTDRFVNLKMFTLLDVDFTEAFYYQRSIGQQYASGQRSRGSSSEQDNKDEIDATTQYRLFTSLLDCCFKDTPNRAAIKSLSYLNLTEVEESMYKRYVSEQTGVTQQVAREFLIVSYVNHSRYLEAIRMHRQILVIERAQEKEEEARGQRAGFGVNMEDDEDEIMNKKTTLTKSQKRQVLVDQLIQVLPEAQRVVLQVEEESERRREQSSKPSLSLPKSKEPFSGVLAWSLNKSNRKNNEEKGSIVATTTTITAIKSTEASKERSGVNGSVVTDAAYKGVVETLVSQLGESGGPLTGLQGLDLDWAAKVLTRHLLEEEEEEESEEGEKTSSGLEELEQFPDDGFSLSPQTEVVGKTITKSMELD
ncbi:hypothetical protein BGW38_007239 [Lunasporangiospora selenospora]|uniref:ELYS-like domain-containing protein n=1 Tax=Lunasporangiospora selenospora TaxID=979761 RepID=A0A9P6FZC1_9FUNG|nr:hypothetical protein BGW38_007239 [Lunasporangiospora selenospora]